MIDLFVKHFVRGSPIFFSQKVAKQPLTWIALFEGSLGFGNKKNSSQPVLRCLEPCSVMMHLKS